MCVNGMAATLHFITKPFFTFISKLPFHPPDGNFPCHYKARLYSHRAPTYPPYHFRVWKLARLDPILCLKQLNDTATRQEDQQRAGCFMVFLMLSMSISINFSENSLVSKQFQEKLCFLVLISQSGGGKQRAKEPRYVRMAALP